jgi:putative transcriptional regulator
MSDAEAAGGRRDVPSMAGRLLVATPLLDDPTFRRSVVLLLDHTSSGGAMGLVLNRPTAVDVEAVLPVWQRFVTLPGRLFRGGPVGLDSALGLVSVPGDAGSAEPIGFHRLVGSVGVVDLDAPPEVVAPGAAGLRIFAGHAGWTAGQLEEEIDEGAWYVVDGEAGDAFSDDPDGLWSEVLRRQHGDLAMVASFPDDPSMN